MMYVSRTLFRMSPAMDVRRVPYSVRLANLFNHLILVLYYLYYLFDYLFLYSTALSFQECMSSNGRVTTEE